MAFTSKKYLALALTGAIILGAGTYLLLNNYFERINIAVAAGDIEKNSKIEEKDIRMLPYYKQALPEGYVSEKSEIVGMLIKTERKTGDPFTAGLFSGEDTAKSMLEKLAEGEVLMAINLNYQEPLIDELKIGNNISIVSTEKEKDSNYYMNGSQAASGTYGNNASIGTFEIDSVSTDGISNDNSGSTSGETSGIKAGETSGSKANETFDSISTETSGGTIDESAGGTTEKDASVAPGQTTGTAATESPESTSTETSDGTIDESSVDIIDEDAGGIMDQTAGSGGKSIIDLNSFSLSENIMIIDGQIIIKNLKIVDIKKTDPESSGLIASKNKSSWCIFIKCSIKEAPAISRITKEDKYKIFLEKVLAE